jgi:hypothetical protein
MSLSAASKYSSYKLYICGRCAIAMPPAVSNVLFFVPVLSRFEMAFTLKIGIIVLATYIVLKMPELYLKNTIGKRQHSMVRAFPDAEGRALIGIEAARLTGYLPVELQVSSTIATETASDNTKLGSPGARSIAFWNSATAPDASRAAKAPAWYHPKAVPVCGGC